MIFNLYLGHHCFTKTENQPCIFPFTIGKHSYQHYHFSCTTEHYPPPGLGDGKHRDGYGDPYSGPPWCSTKNSNEGEPVKWAYCKDECLGLLLC